MRFVVCRDVARRVSMMVIIDLQCFMCRGGFIDAINRVYTGVESHFETSCWGAW